MRGRILATTVAVLMLGLAGQADAHHHHWGGHFGVGFGWYPWYPWWAWSDWPVSVSALERPDVAVVDTDVSPEHARVFLDDKLIGTADNFDGFPDYLYLEPGSYTLEFKLQGYRSETVKIEAAAGKYFPIEMDLTRNPAESPSPWYDRPEGLPTARVFGPKDRPQAPEQEAAPDVSLRPELRERGAGEGERHVVRALAALDFRVSPDNASVYLDGEFIGTGRELSRLERGLATTAGPHRVEVMAPGHKPESLEVSVDEGARQQVIVDLAAEGAPPT